MSDDIIEKVQTEVKKFNWPQIASFWEEEPGSFSMTRLIMFLTVAIPLGIWVIICIYHWSLVEMPSSIIALQGMGVGSKLIQKGQENRAN